MEEYLYRILYDSKSISDELVRYAHYTKECDDPTLVPTLIPTDDGVMRVLPLVKCDLWKIDNLIESNQVLAVSDSNGNYHDFKQVMLTVYHKNGGTAFCKALLIPTNAAFNHQMPIATVNDGNTYRVFINYKIEISWSPIRYRRVVSIQLDSSENDIIESIINNKNPSIVAAEGSSGLAEIETQCKYNGCPALSEIRGYFIQFYPPIKGEGSRLKRDVG